MAIPKDDEIWVSEAPLRSENVKLTLNSFYQQDGVYDESYLFAEKAGKDNAAGMVLSAEHFPEHIYSDRSSQGRKQTFGDIFLDGHYLVVSEATAQVLRQFDLGQGALYPTRLTKSDKETPVGEGWYCLNYGNAKETIIPDRPIGMMRIPRGPDEILFQLGGYMKDDQLTVSRTALASPDLWVDSRLKHGFFVSGRLARAIKEAKLKGFYLARCGLAGARCKELAPAVADISGCTTLMTHARVRN